MHIRMTDDALPVGATPKAPGTGGTRRVARGMEMRRAGCPDARTPPPTPTVPVA
jgi:hypothetical protein